MSTTGNFFRSPSFKFIIIGTLSLLLLIPTAMIRGLIKERELRSQDSANEISESWSLAQTINGPFISIPADENPERNRNTLHVLPEQLEMNGEIFPIEKKRGIFSSVVYNSELHLKGEFKIDTEEIRSLGNNNERKAFFSIGISDLRGIGNKTRIVVNGKAREIEPGLYNHQIAKNGFHVPIDISEFTSSGKISFDIILELKGSSSIHITPVGKKTDVSLNSSWPDPSFDGKFLPDDKNISENGFSSSWGVNYLNRNYPQSWINTAHDTDGSAFGVSLLLPVDHYQKSERSVKYAFMFIALSFLVFFLTEIILKSRIHPIQYLLVGFALIIFYTLLVALSEQIGFNLAYLISTVSVISLVGIYMKSSTRSSRVGLITSLLLMALYGFLFTTLQLQELALLMGSIGLFIILAIIMIVSRKVNWYKEEEPAG